MKLINKVNSTVHKYAVPISVIYTVALFVMIFDTAILHPTYTDWLYIYGGDAVQHQVGWEAFRKAPWRFPIGLFDNATYPESISIIFTDSIPVFAVFFKILSPLLPDRFQYFGIFNLVSFILMGVFSAILLKKYIRNSLMLFTGVTFFVLCPETIGRYLGHDALGGGQWLIIAAMLTIVNYEECFMDIRFSFVVWIILGFIAVGTHVYFVGILFFCMVGYCILDFIKTKKVLRQIFIMTGYVGSAFFSIYLLGAFNSDSFSDPGGWGENSMNLNSLFNPIGNMSKFLAELPMISSTQGEGRNYLGLGLIICFVLSIGICISLLTFNKYYLNKAKTAAFAFIAVSSFVFALSNIVTLNSSTLFAVPLPEFILNICKIFRASGRFGWTVVYSIIIFSLIIQEIFYRHLTGKRRMIVPAFLTACCILQIVDLSPLYSLKKVNYLVYDNTYDNKIWDEIAANEDIKHIIVNDPETNTCVYPLTGYAVANDMTVNRYLAAHGVGWKSLISYVEDSLVAPTESDLFLAPFSRKLRLANKGLNLYYDDKNDWIIGYKGTLNEPAPIDEEEHYTLEYEFKEHNLLAKWKNKYVDDIDGVRFIHGGGSAVDHLVTFFLGHTMLY